MTVPATGSPAPTLGEAATSPADVVLGRLGSGAGGLSSDEAAARLRTVGPNAVRTHSVRALAVLGEQLRSPLLWLLLAASLVSVTVGEGTDAAIIGVILTVSIGLGFTNEYRAERAAQALHSRIRHDVVALRDGAPQRIDAVDLVPGDVVRLSVGAIVPADLRVLTCTDVSCDESVLTGESQSSDKSPAPVPAGTEMAEWRSAMFMGTVVHHGDATAVVVATGRSTQFGAIAAGLDQRATRTDFQRGLARFSGLLAWVAGALSAAILVTNLLLGRPWIDAVLFSLAVAVGITPQLLPAVVSTSLAMGSHRLAERKVLVKRLVTIEDLGDVDVLFTDKTGTLTEGHITFESATDPTGAPSVEVWQLGLLADDAETADGRAVAGNDLDVVLWNAEGAPHAAVAGARRIAHLPFDHERRLASALVELEGRRLMVTKGAPEAVLERCRSVDDPARSHLDALFASGRRVVAVATRHDAAGTVLTAADEADLDLAGFLTFDDRPKGSAAASLRRLDELGISVRIVTGDNPVVATTVGRSLGLPDGGALTGSELDSMSDDELDAAVATTIVYARVSPEQKARIVTAQRRAGSAVAFLGDGVNDALALHHADVGISVDSAADVAKDAADIILLEQDLGVLADGVTEGRRIFANTIKYVLMGTSSNFGNMFSVTVAAAFLPFLPMLPFQILLNNVLYDISQLAIPTDRVDDEQLHRPSHWDISFIRRFMVRFGPISSIFDFLTFFLMLRVFDATAAEFRAGWFVESLATQTLIVFVIRTRRVPFLRSRPSMPLLVSVLAVVAVGVAIPLSPLATTLGFAPLPLTFFAVLVALVVAYLLAVEVAKSRFFRSVSTTTPRPLRRDRQHHVARLARRYSTRRPIDPA